MKKLNKSLNKSGRAIIEAKDQQLPPLKELLNTHLTIGTVFSIEAQDLDYHNESTGFSNKIKVTLASTETTETTIEHILAQSLN